VTDAVAGAARAAAEFFAAECGPGLPAEVEAELTVRHRGDQRPGQYDAGLVVAVAALIVAIAQLAQSIYAMRRQQAEKPTAEVITRETCIQLREREIFLSDQTLRITEFIAIEITRKDPPTADHS
jgi:uncharacterized protein HemX